jgi:O-antigen/teichoic acid export membrane protein
MSIRANIVANYAGRAYSVLSVYLFVPFYVRILGIEAYGVIAFYAVMLTLSGLADIGLAATFSREAARRSDKSSLGTLLGSFERVLLVTVGLVALSIVLLAPAIASQWLNTGDTLDAAAVADSIRLMGLMLLPHFAFSLYSAGLIGLERQVSANVLLVLLVSVRSGLVVLPLAQLPQLPFFFGWQLVATAVFALAARMVLLRRLQLPLLARPAFDAAAIRPHLRFAGGVFAISALTALYAQIDKLIVSRVFTLADFAMYSFAATLAQVPASVALPIASALFPNLTAHIGRGDLHSARLAYERFGVLIVFGAAVGAGTVGLFAAEILQLWLPGQALPKEVATIALLLALAGLFACMQMPPYFLSLAHGQSRPIVVLMALSLAASSSAALVAAPRFGMPGVAAPLLLANALGFVLLAALVNRRHHAGSLWAWFLRCALLPAALALVPLGLLRALTRGWQLSAAATCTLAAALALALFAAGILRTFRRHGGSTA